MLGPTEVEILKYCYDHDGTATFAEIQSIVPVPSVAKDYIKILTGRQFLEPLSYDLFRITEKGIFKIETLHTGDTTVLPFEPISSKG